jgi:hypothetical protein
MKKNFKAACVLAMMVCVSTMVSAQQEDLELSLDSTQREYLLGINDGRTVDSLLVDQLGPMERKKATFIFQNPRDTTKTDTVSITEEIHALFGWGAFIGASASVIADGMTYPNQSIGDHFTFRPELVFGIEGRQLGFGNSPLSNRSNFALTGRLYVNQYAPKTTSAGKKYLTGAFEGYWGYDIFGLESGVHVLSIGPTFGFEFQRMDSVISYENRLAIHDEAFNFNVGARVQYDGCIAESGTHFSVIVGVRFAQVKVVNQTDWTGQVYVTAQIGQLFKPRVAKKELNARNKEIMDHLQPKDQK